MDKANEWMLFYWHLERRETPYGALAHARCWYSERDNVFYRVRKSRQGEMTRGIPDKPKMIEKSSRLGPLKMTCPACGYTLRIAEKWIQTIGAPVCPQHGEMTIHWPLEPRVVTDDGLASLLNEGTRSRKIKSK